MASPHWRLVCCSPFNAVALLSYPKVDGAANEGIVTMVPLTVPDVSVPPYWVVRFVQKSTGGSKLLAERALEAARSVVSSVAAVFACASRVETRLVVAGEAVGPF